MPLVEIAVTLGLTLLAFGCLDAFGLAGIVVWFVIVALFYALCMAIKRRVSGAE